MDGCRGFYSYCCRRLETILGAVNIISGLHVHWSGWLENNMDPRRNRLLSALRDEIRPSARFERVVMIRCHAMKQDGGRWALAETARS
jgi:hypothetical protein